MIRLKQKNIDSNFPNKVTTYYWQRAIPGLDPDAVTFLSAAGITDPTITVSINDLVISLKSAGIWTKMKAIYPFVGGTATTHKYNLKSPQDTNAAFRLSFSGGWTHSANGALPNGTNAYANTYLTPASHQSFTSGHFSLYSRTSSASLSLFGSHGIRDNLSPVRSSSILIRTQSSFRQFFMWGVGGNDGLNAADETDARGFYLGSRTAANSLFYYKNGTTIASTTGNQTQTTLSTSSYFLSNHNNQGSPDPNNYDNKQLAFASIGDGLTGTEAGNFYTAVQTFQTTLGRQV
jgi:hypothetical protein